MCLPERSCFKRLELAVIRLKVVGIYRFCNEYLYNAQRIAHYRANAAQSGIDNCEDERVVGIRYLFESSLRRRWALLPIGGFLSLRKWPTRKAHNMNTAKRQRYGHIEGKRLS